MMSGCLISKLKNTPFRAGTSSKWNFSSQISDVLFKTTSGNNEAWKVRSLFTQSQAISIGTLCKVVMTVLWRHPLWLNLYIRCSYGVHVQSNCIKIGLWHISRMNLLFFQDTLTTELLKFVAREGEYSNWIIKVICNWSRLFFLCVLWRL